MFVNRTNILCLILSTFILISCSQQDKMEIEKSASAFDIKQGEASISQSNKNFMKAYKARDTSQFVNFSAESKLKVCNQEVIEGRKEIAQFFSSLMKDSVKEVKLTTSKISGDSTVLVEEGLYEFLNKKGQETDAGEYIALWKQQSGNWKIYHDILSSSIAKTETKPTNTTKHKH